MSKIKIPLVYTLGILLLASCMHKELPVPAHDPGVVTTAAVNMESDYRYQVYYNLQTGSVAGKNLKTAWDIGFEATADGWHIILNGAKSMYAMPIAKSNLEEVGIADTAGFSSSKAWDAPSGNPDSTAIGNWRDNPQGVYIIDRGYNAAGIHLGIEKLKIVSSDATGYTVEYGPLAAANITRLTIAKDSSYNFMFLSFDEQTTTIIEPPKSEWNIVFTQYTHTFYEPAYQSYLVTGCLLNRYSTTASLVDSSISFAGIDYTYASARIFSKNANTIGYDWKTYTGNNYVTNADKTFLIRDAHGLYYKLHFIDFLNGAGVKGNPKWEYQQL